MEELTLVYLEKEGDENNDELSKSIVWKKEWNVLFFFVLETNVYLNSA